MVTTISGPLRSRRVSAVGRRIPQRRCIHQRYSAQSFAVSLASRMIVKNLVRVWAIQPDLRWPFESLDRFVGLLPDGLSAKIDPVCLDDCPAEWIRAGTTSSRRAILYLHGGAFLTCGLNTHRSLVTRLSKAADACVLNVGYRMLPSHPVSEAIDDALSGLRWLHRRGYDDSDIVVAGDSAGGYLAFATVLAAIRSRLAKPAGVATVSPLTDTDPAAKLHHRNARRCSMFSGAALSALSRLLRRSQVVSPVDADLSDLPPVTIHVSSDELLLPDAELMAQRLDAAGVRCDLHVWDGQIHDFPLVADVLPEGRRAIGYLGGFVREVTGHGAATAA